MPQEANTPHKNPSPRKTYDAHLASWASEETAAACQPPCRAACSRRLKLISPDAETRRPPKAQINKSDMPRGSVSVAVTRKRLFDVIRTGEKATEEDIKKMREELNLTGWQQSGSKRIKAFYKENHTRNKFQQVKLTGGKLHVPVDKLAV